MEQLLTGEDVAEMLKISRSYAYILMKRGDIPTVRIGSAVRVRIEDLDAYIREMPEESNRKRRGRPRSNSTGQSNLPPNQLSNFQN